MGQPLEGVQVEILEGQGLKFSGTNLCEAYFEAEEVSYPTSLVLSDRIRKREEDGIYIYEGRLDSIINRGGQKLSISRLERSLKTELGCEVCVLSEPDSRLGEELLSVIEAAEIPFAKVQKCLRDSFGVHLSSDQIRVVSQLPRNLNQKIDRKRLQAELQKPLSRLPHEPPMLWVSDIVSAAPDGESGIVEVKVNAESLYLQRESLSELAFIEWSAQAYGLIALRYHSGIPVNRVMLVGASGRWKDAKQKPAPKDCFHNHAKRTHQVGPFTIVASRTRLADSQTEVATAKLKVYAETDSHIAVHSDRRA